MTKAMVWTFLKVKNGWKTWLCDGSELQKKSVLLKKFFQCQAYYMSQLDQMVFIRLHKLQLLRCSRKMEMLLGNRFHFLSCFFSVKSHKWCMEICLFLLTMHQWLCQISMKLPFVVLRKSALKFNTGIKRENSISYYFLLFWFNQNSISH